ncbi:aminopeptidase C [Prolixibacter denitrificans]|uniref:Aminopeptidase n=2 Tax=Prolixibacter denitrificans TaxID=1541063 RepID=A0A2P8C8M1_9BACT|nr:C1 family peptidase [Prolixibacter denitrificans]PSK81298.1 bleomycin hydrolase [Prolixibacter denitrificans]
MNRFKFFMLLAGLLAFTWNVSAQDKEKSSKEEGYHFTTVKELPHTSVKDQYRSGTCWAFSGLSFLESEMLRMGKPKVNLSEMFVVYHCYIDKAIKTVRLHGNLNFGPGGAFHDVTYVLKNYGIVPEDVYTGLNYGEKKHVHGEMDDVLKGIVDAVIENKNKKLSTAWEESVTGTLDAYLGDLPTKFEYKGKEYTPKTFANEYCGLNPDDYVEITSFTHHPFYSKFKLEVPDNWEWDEVYNVPLDEMMKIIDNSLNSGYTVAWAADVSEKGFSTSKKGVAVVPDADVKDMTNTELSKWEKLTAKEKNEQLYKLDKPGKEKHITQEMRQEAFDDWQTTDDHGMHIIGLAKDQNGTMYYKVKNSWGDYNAWDGYFYASKPYVRYKTTCIMVNKNAIPKAIREKLGL